MIVIDYDRSTGIIRVRGGGFQTVAEVRQHMRQLALAVTEARRASGRVRLLIDATSTPVQPPEVIEEYKRHPTYITEAQDRMAVIASSSLSKIQMKRNFRSDREQAFLSESEAMSWLFAD